MTTLRDRYLGKYLMRGGSCAIALQKSWQLLHAFDLNPVLTELTILQEASSDPNEVHSFVTFHLVSFATGDAPVKPSWVYWGSVQTKFGEPDDNRDPLFLFYEDGWVAKHDENWLAQRGLLVPTPSPEKEDPHPGPSSQT